MPIRGNVGRHVDDRSAAGPDDRRNAEPAAEEGSEKIEFDDAPEFHDRRLDDGVVDVGGAAGVVVENVQRAIVVQGRIDRRFHAGFDRHVGRHRDTIAAGLDDHLSDLFSGRLVELGDDDFRALGGHRLGGGAADAGARTGDECDLAGQTWHEHFPVVMSI